MKKILVATMATAMLPWSSAYATTLSAEVNDFSFQVEHKEGDNLGRSSNAYDPSMAQIRLIEDPESTRDKEEILSALDQLAAELIAQKQMPLIGARVARTITDFQERPHNRYNGTMRVTFHDTLRISMGTATLDGSSRASWLGNEPRNMRTIRLSDSFTFHGTNLTVSFPIGGTFSGNNITRALNADPVHNSWFNDNNYFNIRSSSVGLTRVSRTATGTFVDSMGGTSHLPANGFVTSF